MPREPLTDVEFWGRVLRGSTDQCWPWDGSRTGLGYGRCKFHGKQTLTHRIAFYLIHNWWPKVVCHSCDNPPCCNPKHLIAGTHRSNSADMVRKGRSFKPKNELHPNCKLSNADVLAIRKLAAKFTYRELGKKFSVTESTVGAIVRNEKRKSVPQLGTSD